MHVLEVTIGDFLGLAQMLIKHDQVNKGIHIIGILLWCYEQGNKAL